MSKNKYYTIHQTSKLLEFINENLTPNLKNKKEHGEVFTPISLVKEMLDKLPKKVWNNPDLKWLDPSVGIGNFPIIVFLELMKGLENWEPDEEKRRKHILENMLYMVDISKKNIYILKKIFCDSEYKLNIFEGSFIDDFQYKVYNPEIKFDIIIGNPPYQKQVGPNKTKPLWNLFIKQSILKLNVNGYLIFVHPAGWRSPAGNFRDIFDLFKKNNLIYLNMNDYEAGKKIFNQGTNFDYYLFQNNEVKKDLIINDIDKKESKINIKNWNFIPSGAFELFKNILASDNQETVEVLYNRSMYGTDKYNMNEKKNQTYKYPCCYTITIKNGLKCYYSNQDTGMFGIPKVIWSNGTGSYPIVDIEGKYGLTQFCYGIVDDIKNIENIKKAMENEKFIELMKYCKYNENHKYNYKVIKLFKKDFYKYILDLVKNL